MESMPGARRQLWGHLLAFFTVLVWGTTFIASKILLEAFSPLEIMFFRLSIAVVLLFAAHPHPIRPAGIRQEGEFFLAGLFGVTLYFLCENTALLYTYASNAGILISAAPFFTGLAVWIFLKEDRPDRSFYMGFLISMAGVVLVSCNGSIALQLNPLGDMLVLLAALCWSFYSVLLRRINRRFSNPVDCTRRIFFYALISMMPLLAAENFSPRLERFLQVKYLVSILFLGVLGSALCYVTWSTASRLIGVTKTTAYIYASPAITMLASAAILSERVTPLAVLGTFLILAGLILSQRKTTEKRKKEDRVCTQS